MNHRRRPEQLCAGCPPCCVCGGPIYDLDALKPGELAMHAECNRISHELAVRRLLPCDCCGRSFKEGQRTVEAQLCEDCLAPRRNGAFRT